MAFFGTRGNAWSKDHDKILDHARGLHYDHVPGVNLPSADAPKQEWIGAMDAFNAWKAREVAKEASGQAWWQTYQSDSGGGGGGNGGGGGGNSGDRTPSYGTTNPQPGNSGSKELDKSTSQMAALTKALTDLIAAQSNRQVTPEDIAEVSAPAAGSGLANTILTNSYIPSSEKKKKSYLTPIAVG